MLKEKIENRDMSMAVNSNQTKRVPLHKRINDEIVGDIQQGVLCLGDKLPSQAEFTSKYNVSVATVRHSLASLERRGIIRREKGRGSFVSLQSGAMTNSTKLRSLGLVTELSGFPADRPAEERMMMEFVNICKEQGIRLVMIQTDFDTHVGGTKLIEAFDELPLDGVCAFLHRIEPEESLAVLAREFRSAVFLTQAPIIGNLSMDSVDVDLSSGISQLMNHLLAIGHRRIAYVGPHVEEYMAGITKNGGGRWPVYKGTLEKMGINVERSLLVEMPYKKGILPEVNAAILNLVKQKNPATAIFTSNDWIARYIMELFWKEGIKVPDDISLAGLDDVEIAKYLVPSLTTVAFPFAKCAQVVVKLMQDRLATPGKPVCHITLNTELIIRDSIRPITKDMYISKNK